MEHVLASQAPSCLNVPFSLSASTTWRIGGTADQVLYPKNTDELCSILESDRYNKKPIYVMGYGSNLLIESKHHHGTIIILKKNLSNHHWIENNLLWVEAGLSAPKLAKITDKAGFNNLTFLAGIPGSVGGAVMMNAGAHHQSIMPFVEKIQICDQWGKTHLLNPTDFSYEYRCTTLPIKGIISGVLIRLEKNQNITIDEVLSYRVKTQPLGLNTCGSVFKNPSNKVTAGWLIEQVGLKGTKYGDLEISAKHANFIVNHGNASSQDMEILVAAIQKRVFSFTGYWLEKEYKILKNCF